MNLKDKMIEKMLGKQLDKLAQAGNMSRNQAIDALIELMNSHPEMHPASVNPDSVIDLLEGMKK